MLKISIILIFLFLSNESFGDKLYCNGGGSLRFVKKTLKGKSWNFIRGGRSKLGCIDFNFASYQEKMDLFAQGRCGSVAEGGIVNESCRVFTGDKNSVPLSLELTSGCNDLGNGNYDVWGTLECSTEDDEDTKKEKLLIEAKLLHDKLEHEKKMKTFPECKVLSNQKIIRQNHYTNSIECLKDVNFQVIGICRDIGTGPYQITYDEKEIRSGICR